MQEQALLESLSRYLPLDLASGAVFSVCMTFNRTGRGSEAAAHDCLGSCSNLLQQEFAASVFSYTKFMINLYRILFPKLCFTARECRSFLRSSGSTEKGSLPYYLSLIPLSSPSSQRQSSSPAR